MGDCSKPAPWTPPRYSPRVFVAGAAKAGTTSMAVLLGRCSGFALLDPKEPHFFSSVEVFAGHADHFQVIRDPELYSAMCSQDATVIDASTSYMWDPIAASRIANSAGAGCVCVLMLRDPVERAYAHYLNNVREGVEERTFFDAVRHELDGGEVDWLTAYVDIGRYPGQVKRFRDTFGDGCVVVFLEEFAVDPLAEVRRVLGRLGAAGAEHGVGVAHENPHRVARGRMTRLIVGSGGVRRVARVMTPRRLRRWVYDAAVRPAHKPTPDPRAIAALRAAYASEAAQLESVIGRTVPIAWSRHHSG